MHWKGYQYWNDYDKGRNLVLVCFVNRNHDNRFDRDVRFDNFNKFDNFNRFDNVRSDRDNHNMDNHYMDNHNYGDNHVVRNRH